jgi:hypothetical protein
MLSSSLEFHTPTGSDCYAPSSEDLRVFHVYLATETQDAFLFLLEWCLRINEAVSIERWLNVRGNRSSPLELFATHEYANNECLDVLVGMWHVTEGALIVWLWKERLYHESHRCISLGTDREEIL